MANWQGYRKQPGTREDSPDSCTLTKFEMGNGAIGRGRPDKKFKVLTRPDASCGFPLAQQASPGLGKIRGSSLKGGKLSGCTQGESKC